MARLGRQINHFSGVIPESIRADFSSDRKHRYTLQMEYRADLLNGERKETTTVILKNPSSADESKADATIRKVETFVHSRFSRTRFLNIYNIFAYRATDAIELQKLMQEYGMDEGIGSENNFFLKELLEDSQQVILAWGGRSGIDQNIYSTRIQQVKDILKTSFNGSLYQVCGMKPTNEPLHGLMWGYDYELRTFTL